MQKLKTILAVDDDGDILNILERILKNAGFHPIIAKSAEEARKLLGQHLPHLIITDLNMEPESGQSLISSIRKMRSFDDIPIIVLSAVNEFAAVKDVMSLGISDYAIKPINAPTILRKIKKALLHKDFLKWEPTVENRPKMTITLDAEVTSLEENRLQLKGPFKLTGRAWIEMNAEKLKEAGISSSQFLVSSNMKTYISAGVFSNDVLCEVSEQKMKEVRDHFIRTRS